MRFGHILLIAVGALAALIVVHLSRQPVTPEAQLANAGLSSQVDSVTSSEQVIGSKASSSPANRGVSSLPGGENTLVTSQSERLRQNWESSDALSATKQLVGTTNKLERLSQTRENFRALAAGDRANALLAARQISNETERETALLTLVTEWTKGEISSPRERARAIAIYGLEAGLGLELAKDPELAVLWANELTDGRGKSAVLERTAITLIESDPVAAFALGEQVPENERHRFYDSLFAGWASKDTETALGWATQMPDPVERDAAMRAIRSVAPVGIGAEVTMRDGYPTINGLLPGTPAEASGQLRRGDRIVALAQGDNAFVDAHNLPLAEVVQRIRGEPGTVLHLQVLPGDAPPDSQPRTVSITRDQIKFKR
jgi:hypothetical protein